MAGKGVMLFPSSAVLLLVFLDFTGKRALSWDPSFERRTVSQVPLASH